MAMRLEWDKFEVALLIDACEQVLHNSIARSEAVSNLSSALRTRATRNGIEIDEVYRNENGISLQMTKMMFLLTEGKIGLPGASKLYAEMVELKKENPGEFSRILQSAKEQIASEEQIKKTNNREKFSQWLSDNPPQKQSKEAIIRALDESSDYCRAHSICKESFWEITDRSLFTAISSKLQGIRIFRLTHRKTALVLDKATQAYKEFLKNQEEMISKEEDISEIPSVTDTVEHGNDAIGNESSIDLSYSKDDSVEIMQMKLDRVTSILRHRYSSQPATSVTEVMKSNEDLPIAHIHVWTKRIKDQTAAQYLLAQGIIRPLDVRSEEEKRNDRFASLEKATSLLVARYANRPASSLSEITKQNPDISFGSYNAWTREFYGKTTSEYLRDKGILVVDEIDPEKLRLELRNERLAKLKKATSVLVSRYAGKPAFSLGELAKQNPDVPVSSINLWAKEFYGKTASEYLRDKGILVTEAPKKQNESPISSSALSASDNEYIEEESLDDDPINETELSLFRTIEYLKTRYEAVLQENHISNSEREMVYKINNYKQDIMWVRYAHSTISQDICIETEPEYIEAIEDELSGFIEIQYRKAHPRQRLFFEDYGSIRKSLISICDSIDNYFEDADADQAQDDREKLYQKLYSISKVYDDPDGISLTKIKSLLGKDVDDKQIRAILDEVTWARRISEDIYSFSLASDKKTSEPEASQSSETGVLITEDGFFAYMRKVVKMAESSCKGYISAIHTSERFAIKNGILQHTIFGSDSSGALSAVQMLMKNAEFMAFNASQHYRFSAAFAKLTDYIKMEPDAADGQPSQPINESGKQTPGFDKERYIAVLVQRYCNGMTFDSIDFDIFRDTYEALYDEKLEMDDEVLEKQLRQCGIVYMDRLFPVEGIIDKPTHEKLFQYIENCFASGKKVLYYKAIFKDMADDFAHCFVLTDEDMLRAYLQFTTNPGEYCFCENYMSKERFVKIDHNAEVAQRLLIEGKPMKVDDICVSLSHIPSDQIRRIITTDSRFIWNATGVYFHTDIFDATKDELEQIAEIINYYISENGYGIWADVWIDIKAQMPAFLENNLYLSSIGIRNALAQRYAGRFSFNAAVISLPKDNLQLWQVYQLFAKHHSTFTIEDLYRLSKELNSVIYFESIAGVSVRVNHDLFVSKDQISFDVDAIDKAIGSFMAKDFIRIREIDSFLAFPNVGYEWNEYLLESFLLAHSKRFILLNNGLAMNNVAGVVSKRNGSIREFVDACAHVLADGPISLNKNEALEYLVDTNMITRRAYRHIDEALRKAILIRRERG